MKKVVVYSALVGTVVLAALAANQDGRKGTLAGPVTHVRDGNTIQIDDRPIRINGIAAPELREPFGYDSRDYLRRLVLGKAVTCNLIGQRSYDRAIGTCYLDGDDIAVTIISAGFARDCARHSGGRYEDFDTSASLRLPLPDYCTPR